MKETPLSVLYGPETCVLLHLIPPRRAVAFLASGGDLFESVMLLSVHSIIHQCLAMGGAMGHIHCPPVRACHFIGMQKGSLRACCSQLSLLRASWGIRTVWVPEGGRGSPCWLVGTFRLSLVEEGWIWSQEEGWMDGGFSKLLGIFQRC